MARKSPLDNLLGPTTRRELSALKSPELGIAEPPDLAEMTMGENIEWSNDAARRARARPVGHAGLRLGETQALRWEAVNLARGTIRVERGMGRLGGRD